MKSGLKKFIVVIFIVNLLAVTTVNAAPALRQIGVWINNVEVNSPKDGNSTLLLDNNLYFSSQFVKDAFNSIILWDKNKQDAKIIKPNVHMLTTDGKNVFGAVYNDEKIKFRVFAQVDSLEAELAAFKFILINPDGKETLIEERRKGDKYFPEQGKNNFWINSEEITYEFDDEGDYKIVFFIQLEEETGMHIVSEKVIYSTAKSS
ncbi:hypothetical protein [Paenibacillus herberti]|uniref:Copper amine oxidase-like N-terminal domain-containing protein n=1 Tax=Paenibacillus herberti TaxID=1619309 RepID=A0A229NYW5_9BACL|nr:hypothetical protein [Paenibacillus herberti]OXM14849.1 hypothetical protein CGZ75_18455 [Paenibacillus herberti]